MKKFVAAIFKIKLRLACTTKGSHAYSVQTRFDRNVKAVYQNCLRCGKRKYHWGVLWA